MPAIGRNCKTRHWPAWKQTGKELEHPVQRRSKQTGANRRYNRKQSSCYQNYQKGLQHQLLSDYGSYRRKEFDVASSQCTKDMQYKHQNERDPAPGDAG